MSQMKSRRPKQLVLFPEPPRPKRPAVYIEQQWKAIESTYVTAKRAGEAYPGVPLRDVCRIRLEIGWGDKRQLVAEAFGTRANFQEIQAELVRNAPAGTSLCIGFDQRPYATKNPLYPKYAEWLGGKRPAEGVGDDHSNAPVPDAAGSAPAEASQRVAAADPAQAAADDLAPAGDLPWVQGKRRAMHV